MKLLDANVLLYAFDSSAAHHAPCREWLEQAFQDDELIGLPWQTTLAFIRISTNPRAVRTPIAMADATEIVATLLSRPQSIVVEAGEQFWPIFRRLTENGRVSGPLVTDAVLAALSLENGATLCSTDRDFRRFDGLRLFDPSASR